MRAERPGIAKKPPLRINRAGGLKRKLLFRYLHIEHIYVMGQSASPGRKAQSAGINRLISKNIGVLVKEYPSTLFVL